VTGDDEPSLYPTMVRPVFSAPDNGQWEPWTDDDHRYIGWRWSSWETPEHRYVYLVPDEGGFVLYRGATGNPRLDSVVSEVRDA